MERFEGEASAVKVVDVQEGVGERITGSALWGWSERVGFVLFCCVSCFWFLEAAGGGMQKGEVRMIGGEGR